MLTVCTAAAAAVAVAVAVLRVASMTAAPVVLAAAAADNRDFWVREVAQEGHL